MTTRSIFLTLCALLCAAVLHSKPSAAPQRLQVSENHRYLVDQDGKPFFYLADTGWELFHRLTREEADHYLRDRASMGFTVIQAVAVAEHSGINVENAYGHLPFVNHDPLKPAIVDGEANDYWDHVDYIVRRANALGLYVGLLPTWGCYWHDGEHPPFSPDNARRYGEWIARRYRNDKVIWILGGDRNPENDRQRLTIREMAQGLRAGDDGLHLITFHPGGSWGSADFWHDEPWLDFNMRQNGHNHWYQIYAKTRTDYDRQPVKPVIDGEPIYEDHPVAFDPAHRGFSVAADCRRALYWDLFNGACGHTYGHHAVWQMYEPGKRQPINHPLMSWQEALRQPGASQMQHARRLLESRPFLTRLPATDDVLIPSADDPSIMPGQGLAHFAATMDEGRTYLMVYAPVGRPFGVRTSVLAPGRLKGWWFNPRNGKSHSAGKIARGDNVTFTSPTPGEQTDWVLVIDVASAGYGRP